MAKLLIRNIEYILDSGDSLFSEVNFSLDKGDKAVLIGRNGSGKTTLLKILSGSIHGEGEVIGNKSMFYIPQLKETGFENYSGGEYIRHYIELAKKENPEVLLLDEPTNHLDQEGREILQEYVNSFKGILIFVSHDVAFIKKNAKKILSLSDGNLENYTGSYEEYLEYKKLEKEGVERARSALKKEERKLKEALQIEHKRSQRTISNSKKEGYYDNDKFAKGFFKDHSQFAHGKIKGQIERLRESNKEKQDEHVLPEDLNVSFVFPASDSKRSLLIKLKSANLSIANRQLLADFDFEIYFGDKVYLKGKNGSGKSLFVKSLINRTTDAKESFFKENIRTVYLDQFYEIIDRDKTIFENVLVSSPTTEKARKILSLYGFRDQHLMNQKASLLSGGELCRLSLAKISQLPIDLLILDEPTNNLDIDIKEVLLASLKKFKGAMLVISHDSEFVTELGLDKEFKVELLN